jgi:hypothetical protein
MEVLGFIDDDLLNEGVLEDPDRSEEADDEDEVAAYPGAPQPRHEHLLVN